MAEFEQTTNAMTIETNTKEVLPNQVEAMPADGASSCSSIGTDDSNGKTSEQQSSTAIATTVSTNKSSPLTALSEETSSTYPLSIINGLDQFKPIVAFPDLSFEEKIGHGSFGVVYKVKWQTRLVAAKEFMANPDQAEAIETEVRQLSRVSHPNIIELYAITANQHSIYLIMEFMEGGSLHTFLHGKVKPYYSTAHAMSWARQCAEGVTYLHAMKPKPLIHRDLKPLNLLLTNKGRHLKICDFGTVADQATKMTNNRGTAVYMAPEVFSSCKYDEKCDVFSWATVLWVVLMRQQPFADITNAYSIQWQIHKGHRPPMNPKIPQPIQNLMQACWLKEPAERPPMAQVLAFMKKLTADLPGADEPLEYEFKHLQIVCTDTTHSTDSYQLDFSNLKSTENSNTSLELTPTNSANHTNNSDYSLTPTNSTEGHANFIVPTTTQIPTARIAGLTRWGAIPEESESSLYDQKDNTDKTDAQGNAFNLTSSPSAIKRYETIRNGMAQKVNFNVNPLSVDVDPRAWDLIYARSDGKEGLTVTETKPMIPNSSMAERDFNAATHYDVEDNDDADDPSLAEMLDPELQPEQPIPDNEESQAIYREHRRLAKEYLRVDTKLYYAQDFKEKILIGLDPEERQKKQEMLRKIQEKQELLELYNNLKQQRENLLAEQTRAVRPNSAGVAQQQMELLAGNARTTPANGAQQHQEMLADDGWVVIQPNQNA
ncbi:mitogen-activated protein kinase kinase kinase 7-like [Anastrepha obliqua]|uniref:mitogen-activated protein kinase kinase kinase 7-like n=1 Tax=Anastrepha obliqua TaxID=95512 RepID=UPI00240A28F4|nr:mitogen-activated protein kinase kinase kinase 7-like [Anastrepha obliqua]XP_054728630.1 mitogen-activated protein kinase kinase kinase 7-like [Anastrepha obliqua]